MNRRTQLALGGVIVGVALVVALFGGGLFASGSSTSTETTPTDTPTTNTEDGGRGPQKASIGVYPLRFNPNVTDTNETLMQVAVQIIIWGYKNVDYDSLQLCAYAKNGTLLQGESLGNISTSPPPELYKTIRANLTIQTRPHYLIVDHPRLRNDSRFSNQVRMWYKDGYTLKYENLDEIQNRFEWPRTNETGTCG